MAANPKSKRSAQPAHLIRLVSEIQETQESHQQQGDVLLERIASLQQEVNEMKEMISRLKPVQPKKRGGIFGGRRRVPVEVLPEPVPVQNAKSGLQLEDLLPLLPQLSSVMPQFSNPKVAEAIKVLSNPAVLAMIQQFLANGKPKAQPTPASNFQGRKRR